MRTTLNLDDDLFRRLKQIAAERGVTLRQVVDEALRQAFAARSKGRSRPRVRLPLSRHKGGLLPGVNLADSASLLDRMEGR